MSKIQQDLIRDEEYKIWKKNTIYLYDVIASYELEWPSLTVSWFPDKINEPGRKYSTQRILLGTHTSEGEQNCAIIAHVKLPKSDVVLEEKLYNDETAEYGGFGSGGSVGKLEIKQKINVPGEINRARIMPQNADIFAVKTNFSEILIFDRTRHPSEPFKNTKRPPEKTLIGHSQEGYGISWNHHIEGLLLSGSDDGKICIWNINTKENTPLQTFTDHNESIIEDVTWHYHSTDVFASASDDKTVRLWDLREKKSYDTITGHRSEVNSVAFSPHFEFFLVSGSKDKTVGLWDVRNTKVRLHLLEGHEDSIFGVEWSPTNESVVASCGADRRVILWDLSLVGKEQSPEDAADGPPELIFMHGGHTDKVCDMAWNGNEDWCLASVADDNVLQVWNVSKDIFEDKNDYKGIELE